MPLSQLPLPAHSPSTGLPISSWISKVRDAMEDIPLWKTDTFTGDGAAGVLGSTSGPIKTSKFPLNDYDAAGNNVNPVIKVAGVAQTVVYTGSPSNGQVLVNLDTGECVFGTAPANAAAVTFGYYSVRWRDQKILDALAEGLHRCWPAIGRYYQDTTIRPQILTWDYQLPAWAQTEESRILDVWYRDPDNSVEPWRSLSGLWERKDLTTLHIYPSQQISVAGRFQVYGYGPCLELGDLPPQYFDLPIWYAAGSLMMKKEVRRARDDTMTPTANEGAVPVGSSATLGKELMDQFNSAIASILSHKSAPIGWKTRLVNGYLLRPR